MSVPRNPLTIQESFNYKGINFVMFAYKAKETEDAQPRCWVTLRPSPSADSDVHDMMDENPLTPRDWSQNRGPAVAIAGATSPNQPYDDDQLKIIREVMQMFRDKFENGKTSVESIPFKRLGVIARSVYPGDSITQESPYQQATATSLHLTNTKNTLSDEQEVEGFAIGVKNGYEQLVKERHFTKNVIGPYPLMLMRVAANTKAGPRAALAPKSPAQQHHVALTRMLTDHLLLPPPLPQGLVISPQPLEIFPKDKFAGLLAELTRHSRNRSEDTPEEMDRQHIAELLDKYIPKPFAPKKEKLLEALVDYIRAPVVQEKKAGGQGIG